MEDVVGPPQAENERLGNRACGWTANRRTVRRWAAPVGGPGCRWAVGLLLWLGAAACPGCSPRSTPPEVHVAQTQPAKPTLKTIDEQGFAELLQDHRGKVLLVDFWADWCGPCKQLFPHTVALHKKYADSGLQVVAISLDDEQQRERVREFLAKMEASFENFISRYGGSDRSLEAFGIEGTLPTYQLYDRRGKLRETFAAGQQVIDPKQIDRAVQRLLDESEPLPLEDVVK